MKKSTRTSEAGKLVRVGSVELSKRLPWKKRRAWSKTLEKLSADGLLIKSQKRISGLDQTFSFAVHDNLLSRADQDPIHFLAGDAAEYGVCAAVLLSNLRFFLRQNIIEHGQQRRHAMKPSGIVERLPFFSLSSVKRALDALCKAEQVKREWNPKILASEYWIPGYAPEIAEGVDPHRVAVNSPAETIAPSEVQFAAEPPEVKSGVFERLVESNRVQLASEPREMVHAEAVVAAEEASSLIETIQGRDLLKIAQYTDDQLVAVLQARAQSRGDFPPSGIVLETAVLALRYDAVGARSSHELVLRHACRLSLKLTDRRNKELTKRYQQTIADWKVRVEEALQPLAAKLDANNLTPAAKRTILRQALAVRAKLQMMREPPYLSAPTLIPYPCGGTNVAFKAAEIFFRANRSWSARLLFEILEGCAQLDEYPGENDPQFHARRGVDLAFLLRHFDNVIKQLEIESSVPEFVLVDADELFPMKNKREADPSTSPNA